MGVKHSVQPSTQYSSITMSLQFIVPLAELAKDDMVQSKMEEAAKLLFQTDTFTLNLFPALLVTTLFLFLGVSYFILFQPLSALKASADPFASSAYNSAIQAKSFAEFESKYENLVTPADTHSILEYTY